MPPQIPLGVYRHYKGGRYVVFGVAHNSTNGPGEGQWLVLYRVHDAGIINAREVSEFQQSVVVEGALQPRFRYEGPAA